MGRRPEVWPPCAEERAGRFYSMVPFSPAECGRTAARIRRRQGRSDTRKVPPLEGRVASGVSRKPDDGRGDPRSAFHPSKQTAIRYDTSSVACGDTFPSRGRTWERNSSRFCVRRNGLRVKIPPLKGGWHPASPASRMTEEVNFVPLLHPSKEAAARYVTSSVACGDTFPSRGRTWERTVTFSKRIP